ncbi:MAG: hypothetical protein JSR54_09260 [Proteobacteria bacterium]|nr:hypothetical protein [Pseudomonadota bacterium]
MPTDGNIDFRTYNRDDLAAAVERIDREQYPLNFRAATEEFAKRGPDLTAALAAQTKPHQVATAVRLSWASFAIGTVTSVLFQLSRPTPTIPILDVLSWPLALCTNWWILGEIGNGKNWARMVVVVLTPPWALLSSLGLLALLRRSPAASAIGAFAVGLSIGSFCLLIGRPSRDWFKRLERHRSENAELSLRSGRGR